MPCMIDPRNVMSSTFYQNTDLLNSMVHCRVRLHEHVAQLCGPGRQLAGDVTL